MDEATALEKAKEPAAFGEIPAFEKANKEKIPMLLDFGDYAELKNNDHVSLICEAEGRIGMKRPQKHGAFFRIIASSEISDAMPAVVIFNHEEMH